MLQGYHVKDRYDICTALRGPDDVHRGDFLKTTITRRLRAIAFPDREPAAWADYTSVPLTVDEVRVFLARLLDAQTDMLYHAMGHLCVAVMATQTHVVWGGFGLFLVHALKAKAGGAALPILPVPAPEPGVQEASQGGE